MFGKDMVFSEGGANTWMGVWSLTWLEATVALCDITKGIFSRVKVGLFPFLGSFWTNITAREL